MQKINGSLELPARNHAEAAALFRRPFAPGAIGFRAMMKVPYNGDPQGGAHVAAYLGAQSVLQRLNAVVPGRWRMEFKLLQASSGAKKRYMTCRLITVLPLRERGGRDVEAVYEDVGELEIGSPAGLKALYSDARKRVGVAAGTGAYLYTALQPVVLPIGPGDRHVQLVSRPGGEDLVLTPGTEAWLREGYARQMNADAVRRDLGEILSHGEPEGGIGQGEVAEQAPRSPGESFWNGEPRSEPVKSGEERAPDAGGTSPAESSATGNGIVHVDFSGRGPDAA